MGSISPNASAIVHYSSHVLKKILTWALCVTNWTAESEHIHGDMLRFEYNCTFIILASDGILFLHKTPGWSRGRQKEPPLTVVKTTWVTFESCVKCVHKSKTDGKRLSIIGSLEMDPIKLTSGTSCWAIAVAGLRLGSKISKSPSQNSLAFSTSLSPPPPSQASSRTLSSPPSWPPWRQTLSLWCTTLGVRILWLWSSEKSILFTWLMSKWDFNSVTQPSPRGYICMSAIFIWKPYLAGTMRDQKPFFNTLESLMFKLGI